MAKRTSPLARILQLTVAVVLVAAAVYAGGAIFVPAPSVAASVETLDDIGESTPTIDWPTTPRAAGYAIDGMPETAQHWGSESSHPMASVTKLVTVLVVLDKHPIAADSRGETIPLDETDQSYAAAALADNAPIFPVRVGGTVEQRSLVEYALVDSAANAAMSLARWGFGSIEAFLDASDAFLAAHDLSDTSLADPAGLNAESVSTAADLTQLALLAVDNPVILASIQLESVTIPGIGYAPNTNRILGVDGIDGGKTGTLKVWGRNLFVTAKQNIEGVEVRVVAIIMGTISADDTDAAMRQLLDSIWPNFTEQTLVPAGTVAATYTSDWGEVVHAVTKDDLTTLAWPGTGGGEPQITARDITVSSVIGDVGTVTIDTSSGTQLRTEIATESRLQGPSLLWRLGHPDAVLSWALSGE